MVLNGTKLWVGAQESRVGLPKTPRQRPGASVTVSGPVGMSSEVAVMMPTRLRDSPFTPMMGRFRPPGCTLTKEHPPSWPRNQQKRADSGTFQEKAELALQLILTTTMEANSLQHLRSISCRSSPFTASTQCIQHSSHTILPLSPTSRALPCLCALRLIPLLQKSREAS